MLQGTGGPSWVKDGATARAIFDSLYWRGLCLLVALIILWVGSLTPLGFADGSLYLFPLLLAGLGSSEGFLIAFASLASAFTIAGFFTSPPGIDLVYVLINRSLSVAEIALLCGTTIVVKRQLARQLETSGRLLNSQTLIDEQREQLTMNQHIVGQLKRRFYQVADTVPQIIWTAETNGMPDYANKAFLSFCGVDNGKQLLGEGWKALVHPEDLRSALASWQHTY